MSIFFFGLRVLYVSVLVVLEIPQELHFLFSYCTLQYLVPSHDPRIWITFANIHTFHLFEITFNHGCEKVVCMWLRVYISEQICRHVCIPMNVSIWRYYLWNWLVFQRYYFRIVTIGSIVWNYHVYIIVFILFTYLLIWYYIL